MELVGRLHPSRLGGLAAGVARPVHDRTRLRAGIVHLGLGAFARAHLAAVNEAALAAGAGEAWGICGVSLRQPDTRDALAPQDGLYTLALRDADEHGEPRQRLAAIGCLLESLVAPEDPQAVLARIAHEDARIVSLTVTEKGYCHDPASGQLNLDHPDIVHDLGQPLAPRSAIGYLAWACSGVGRRGAGRSRSCRWTTCRPTAICCAAWCWPSPSRWMPGWRAGSPPNARFRARWWTASCRAPPTPTARRWCGRWAWRTPGRSAAEPYLEWVLEDSFAAGRLTGAGGARFVAGAAPFETLKLRNVNGAHSALAYLSVMAGWDTVDQALAQPALRRYLERLMREEIAPTLPPLPGLDLAQYQERLLRRFANPALRHQTRQIAMDGSQKLPQRLLDTARARLAREQPMPLLALAVAGWLHYLRGVDQAGRRYDIQDPMAGALARLLEQAETAATLAGPGPAAMLEWTAALAGFEPVFGELGQDARFVRAVAQAVHALRSLGVAGALEALDGGGR